MALLAVYKDLVDEIITQLKTITQLADDSGDTRVHKWLGKRRMKTNDYEAVVMAGPMRIVGGFTSNSTENNFTIFVDLSFNSQDISTGFDNAMTLAEKVYDKFHLTNINNKCRQATVQLEPGETQVGGLYMITIRCVILCSKVVTQT
jgi:hypothetical protein